MRYNSVKFLSNGQPGGIEVGQIVETTQMIDGTTIYKAPLKGFTRNPRTKNLVAHLDMTSYEGVKSFTCDPAILRVARD